MKKETNIYMKMPIDRVREDAIAGVSAAREAWRQRDPDGAAREIRSVIEPSQQQRVLAAAGKKGKSTEQSND